MEIEKIYDSILTQQLHTLTHVAGIIKRSGNLHGVSQWRDRNKLHKINVRVEAYGHLLSKKDFQFLERLILKYKL